MFSRIKVRKRTRSGRVLRPKTCARGHQNGPWRFASRRKSGNTGSSARNRACFRRSIRKRASFFIELIQIWISSMKKDARFRIERRKQARLRALLPVFPDFRRLANRQGPFWWPRAHVFGRKTRPERVRFRTFILENIGYPLC